MAIVLGRKGGGSGGGGGGSVNEITSTDNSVTITDPSGPTVDLSVSGGSQPCQFGSGFPDENVIGDFGTFYYDTDLGSLWVNGEATGDPPGWIPVQALLNATGDAAVQVAGSGSNLVSVSGAVLEMNTGPAPTGSDILTGTADPTAGAGLGVNLPAPALYMRNNGGVSELWIKTGGADTDWTQIALVP